MFSLSLSLWLPTKALYLFVLRRLALIPLWIWRLNTFAWNSIFLSFSLNLNWLVSGRTHWERGQFIEFIFSHQEWNDASHRYSWRSWVRTGSNPVVALIFSGFFFPIAKLKIYRDDHSSLSSTTAVQIWIISYILHIILLFSEIVIFMIKTSCRPVRSVIITCPHATTFTLLSIFPPLEVNSIKLWETKCSLPKYSLAVAVCVSKTCLLKLPIQ